jgi:hypothetical protein
VALFFPTYATIPHIAGDLFCLRRSDRKDVKLGIVVGASAGTVPDEHHHTIPPIVYDESEKSTLPLKI